MTGDLDELDRLDFYTLLGADPSASEGDIRKAFRSFARRYHPDRYAGASADQVERADKIYRRGTEALQTLCDEAARGAYDESLRRIEEKRSKKEKPPSEPFPPEPSTGSLERPPEIASAGARWHYKMAIDALRNQDYEEARDAIILADRAEPGNPVIEARMDQVSALLRRALRKGT